MGEVTDVQRTLKVILSEGAEPTAMSSGEFQAAVRDGTIEGNTPVWGRIFTNGEWQVAADLRIFHSASPTPVALGPYLQKLVDDQTRPRTVEPAYASWRAEVEELRALISTPDERLKASGAEAVWILGVAPWLCSSEFVIVEDRGATVEVQRFRISRRAFEPPLELRQQAVLNYQDLPELARDRRSFEALLAAPRTRVNYRTLDGTSYKLQYCSRDSTISACWDNPTTEMPRESLITNLVGELVQAAFGETPEHYRVGPRCV